MNIGNRGLGVIFAWMLTGNICLITERALAQGAVAPPGTGTSGDPYRISQLGNLVWMRANIGSSSGKYYTVQNDIEAAETTNWNSGKGFAPIGTNWMPRFEGIFNGNGKVIQNLWINRANEKSVGLFGYLGGAAIVKNLGIEGGTIVGSNGVGALVAWNYGTITGCYATASIVGAEYKIGGLIGESDGTVIGCSASGSVLAVGDSGGGIGGLMGSNNGFLSGCHASGSVKNSSSNFVMGVGGLLGWNQGDATVSNCYATGDVLGSHDVGGLVGEHYGALITRCHAEGSVTGLMYAAGGLIGDNSSVVTKSFAKGPVSGWYYVGGLIGGNSGGTVSVCYASGSVTGSFQIGGLVGVNSVGAMENNCYASGAVAGGTAVGGLVGANNSDVVLSKCFAVGRVTGTSGLGGIVGDSIGTTLDSYWDTNTTGVSTAGGGVGGGTGRSTTQMKQQATFTGWDFAGIWGIVEGAGYPYLQDFVWGGAISFPAGLPTGDAEPDYVAWVADNSLAWQAGDFSSLSVADFVAAWLVDVKPASGVATSCQLQVSSFLAMPTLLVVGLDLKVGESNKAGRINGWLAFEGTTSPAEAWETVASQQAGDENFTFDGGMTDAAFDVPTDSSFFSATIVKVPVQGVSGVQPVDTP